MNDNNLSQKYLDTYYNIELRLTDEEAWYSKLDVLWHSLTEEEIKYVEAELDKRNQALQAPESLNLIDQSVNLGESISPRKPTI